MTRSRLQFVPELWAANIAAIMRAAENPIERHIRESTERRWARLEAENPIVYRREQRRLRIRKWCRAHHLPVPWWMRYPRLPADPRFENWNQPCVGYTISTWRKA